MVHQEYEQSTVCICSGPRSCGIFNFLWADQLIDIVLLIFTKCLEGRSFQFEDFSHKLPKYKLIT